MMRASSQKSWSNFPVNAVAGLTPKLVYTYLVPDLLDETQWESQESEFSFPISRTASAMTCYASSLVWTRSKTLMLVG